MGPIETKGLILIGALGVAGLCYWIAYRLYLHGVIEKGKVRANGGGLKVEASDYGPGVVFAILGTFIVIFAITRSMSESTTKHWSKGADDLIYSEEVAAAAAEVAPPREDDRARPD